MDSDNKRPYEDEEQPVKKLKPLNQLSEDGPLTQGDVVYFQKEAIWRQMRIYKQNCARLTKDVETLKEKYEANEQKINCLDMWYEQIYNNIKGYLSIDQSEELNEFLLIRVTNASTDSVSQTLDRRREELLKVLTPLFKEIKSASVEGKDWAEQYEKLNSEYTALKASNSTLGKLKYELERKVDDLEKDILHIMKEQERQNSNTLKRVDESIANGHTEDKDSSHMNSQPNQSSSNGKEVEIDNEKLESLTTSLDDAKHENKLLEEQMSKLSEKYHSSMTELENWKDRLHNLTEADFQNSSTFQQLSTKKNELSESIVNLQKSNDAAINKLNKLEASQNNIREFFDKAILQENEQLKSQLSKNENDLARIRAARDELLSKQTILKLELDNRPVNEALSNTNRILHERIRSLEKERNKGYEDNKLADLSKEELLQRVLMMTEEIKEIEQVFEKTRESSLVKLNSAAEQESLNKKLTIEKTKADQKYFASMRLKDSLVSENRILKAQVSKSQELINKLGEAEKKYLEKIEALTTSVTEYKTIKESSIKENMKLRESVSGLDIKCNALERNLDSLKSSYSDKTERLNDSEHQLSEKTNSLSKLQHKLQSTDLLLKKYKSNNTTSILQEDEKQLEALRSIAKCSVCSKNWKDTVITACGHVFCQKCVQERLAARLRRCPTCNKGFSANDMLGIHL